MDHHDPEIVVTIMMWMRNISIFVFALLVVAIAWAEWTTHKEAYENKKKDARKKLKRKFTSEVGAFTTKYGDKSAMSPAERKRHSDTDPAGGVSPAFHQGNSSASASTSASPSSSSALK